jgi:hypothetical protein
MVDDGARELPAKPAHTAVCHRGGVAILPVDAVRHPAGYVNMGTCLARPDRTIKIPPGRDPGRAKAEGKDGARSAAPQGLIMDLAATVHQFPPAAEPAEG